MGPYEPVSTGRWVNLTGGTSLPSPGREVVRSISEGTGVTSAHLKFGGPVPDQAKLGVTFPRDSGTPRPYYVFAGSHPPNCEGTNYGRILSFADPWLLPALISQADLTH